MKMFILTDEKIMAVDGNFIIRDNIANKNNKKIDIEGKVLIDQDSDEGFKAVYTAFINDIEKEMGDNNG
jgi:hypothetical protein